MYNEEYDILNEIENSCNIFQEYKFTKQIIGKRSNIQSSPLRSSPTRISCNTPQPSNLYSKPKKIKWEIQSDSEESDLAQDHYQEQLIATQELHFTTHNNTLTQEPHTLITTEEHHNNTHFNTKVTKDLLENTLDNTVETSVESIQNSKVESIVEIDELNDEFLKGTKSTIIPRESYQATGISKFNIYVKKRKEIPELKFKLSSRIDLLVKEAKDDIEFEHALLRNNIQLQQQYSNEEKELWVDKYKPKHFVDLVGNDYHNKKVLSWVNHWRFCVFNKPVTKEFKELKDKLYRPEKKLLLITGPPGIGKTSLAHIVASHYNYRTVEINASDDRTLSMVKSTIIDALTQRTLTKKPNLLILDEVDGVSGSGLLEFLVEIATDKCKKIGKLKRPIILIANSIYQLNRYLNYCESIVINGDLNRPTRDRLRNIARFEGVEIKPDLLSRLLDQNNGDLRSCINALQFMTIKSDNTVPNKSESTGIEKDAIPPYFTLLSQVFAGNCTTLELLPNHELAYLINGCFQNYLKIPVFDAAATNSTKQSPKSRILTVLDHLIFSDIQKDSDYLKSVVQMFSVLYKSLQKIRFDRPVSSVNVERVKWRIQENVELWRQWRSPTLVHSELYPYLQWILTPSIPATNEYSLSNQQRSMLERIIDIMLWFDLAVVKKPMDHQGFNKSTNNESNNPIINTEIVKLDPDIEACRIEPFCLSRKTINDYQIGTITMIENRIFKAQPHLKEITKKSKIKQKKVGQPKKPEQKLIRDFFGRIVHPNQKINTKQAGNRNINRKQKTDILYVFNEGYSNAVRKPLKMQELINK